MLITEAKYFNNYGRRIEWKIPIDIIKVIFAKRIIKKYLNNKNIDEAILNSDNTYTIDDIQISRLRENSVIFRRKNMIKIYKSYYVLRFGVPITNILKYNNSEGYLQHHHNHLVYI